MSLVITLEEAEPTDVHWQSITHDLTAMAEEAGIYKHLWHPEEVGVKKAMHLIKPLTEATEKMAADPVHYKKYDAENVWGTYDDFLPWLRRLLWVCEKHPSADIRVSI